MQTKKSLKDRKASYRCRMSWMLLKETDDAVLHCTHLWRTKFETWWFLEH